MRTYWYCERCGSVGYVTHGQGQSIYTVKADIEQSHKDFKPRCRNTILGLHVLSNKNGYADLPDWVLEILNRDVVIA